jgi:hypothetical protein
MTTDLQRAADDLAAVKRRRVEVAEAVAAAKEGKEDSVGGARGLRGARGGGMPIGECRLGALIRSHQRPNAS